MNYDLNTNDTEFEKMLTKSESFHVAHITVHFAVLLTVLFESLHFLQLHAASFILLILAATSMAIAVRSKHLNAEHRFFKISLLMSDSLGEAAQLTTHEECHAPKDYFSSSLPKGVPRLASNLAETLFFAHHLYKNQAKLAAPLMLLPGIVVVAIAFIAPGLSDSAIVISDRLLLLIVVFFNEAHVISNFFELLRARDDSQHLLFALLDFKKSHNLERPTNQNAHLSVLAGFISLVTRYHVLAALTPYPKSKIYTALRNKLNAEWCMFARKHGFN